MAVEDSIIIASLGGFIAGISVWGVNELKNTIIIKRDKKIIKEWLLKVSKRDRALERFWRSTTEISNYTNLTRERVSYICSIHKEIRTRTGDDNQKDFESQNKDYMSHLMDEYWALKKFVRLNQTVSGSQSVQS